MWKNSRSKNTILNILVGYTAQIGLMLMSFIGRRVFLHYLSIEYLGINGLFSNILSVLSLAELGIGNVMVFSLYKPVAENDYNKICALIGFYKRAYIFVASGVMIIGISLIPFLNYLTNNELEQAQLVLYYLIFLSNSVCSYFTAHNIAFLNANQDMRIQKIILLFFSFFQQITQITILVVFQNYVVYILIQLFYSICINATIGIVVNKRYPYLKKISSYNLVDKSGIINNISSTALYKLGSVAINSTGNILISILVSISAVGLYSNYYMVVGAIQSFIAIITTSMLYGVGNLNTENNKEKLLNMFNVTLFIFHFISTVGAISFNFILQDFILLWLGDTYLLDYKTIAVISLNFYLTNAVSPIWMYREATGLFAKVKYLMLIRAALNLFLAIVFGKLWGMFGILLATALSMVLTSVWYEPRLLFRTIFEISSLLYWKNQLKYFFCSVVCFILSYSANLALGDGWIDIFVKAISFFVISLLMFYVFFIKTPEFKWLYSKFSIKKVK